MIERMNGQKNAGALDYSLLDYANKFVRNDHERQKRKKQIFFNSIIQLLTVGIFAAAAFTAFIYYLFFIY